MAVHVSPELLASVLRGDLPPSTLVTLVHRHLGELCPECRRAFEEVQQDSTRLRLLSQRPPSAEGDGYDGAFERATCRALEEADRRQEREAAARRDLAELLALPAEERAAHMAGSAHRFRGRRLAELLLEESASQVRRRPLEARCLAELVEEVLVHTPGALLVPWGESLAVRAHAHRANALRVAGDLVGSDRLFRKLRSRLASLPVDDAEAHAEICSLEASLRQNQRRAEEAEILLERAVLLYRQARNTHGVARILVQKASLYLGAQEPLSALDCLEEASRLVDAQEDPVLHLCLVTNRVVCLCDLERYEEAVDLLDASAEALATAGDEWFDVRMTWTRGRIYHGLGRVPEAEDLLADARNSFLADGNDFNAALVSLDLALIYLEEGRWPELRELAAGVGTAFEARQLPQHELSALILFQQAAAQERVTVEALRKLRYHLQPSREELAVRQSPLPS